MNTGQTPADAGSVRSDRFPGNAGMFPAQPACHHGVPQQQGRPRVLPVQPAAQAGDHSAATVPPPRGLVPIMTLPDQISVLR